MGQPPDLIPARFPKIGRTGSIRFAKRWKKRLGTRFYQKCARAKNKNGNSFMTSLTPHPRRPNAIEMILHFTGYHATMGGIYNDKS
jgi:hypothetical protein